jgi:hypothetical protein
MDDIVRQAMAKWPHVPNCYGWLGLDARGNWYMRDDRVQALGAFASGVPGAKGSRLQHEKLIAFIQRNYEPDDAGRWYFQNGPQRVYVELEHTPWVWRLEANESVPSVPTVPIVRSHTGRTAEVLQCVVDAEGLLYLHTNLGFGLVHTQDVLLAADWIEQGLWHPQELAAAELPSAFQFVMSPQAQPATAPALSK